MKFVLASASPRRREILSKFGFEFEVYPSDFEEKINQKESAQKTVEQLALGKAESVFKKLRKPTLGADTVVVLDGKILGKPHSDAEHKKMLSALSGRTHLVITGYAFITEKDVTVSSDVSKVTFNDLSEQEIDDYIKSGLGSDKAGGYGVQDGCGLVKGVEGSYYNVVGLPIEKIIPILEDKQ